MTSAVPLPPAPRLTPSTPAEFLTTVTHEVRTPLNAVIGMTELLRQMALPCEAASLVETIHMSGEHLLALVDDLLDVTRIDAGRLVLEQVDFVLRDVVEEAIEMAAATSRAKGLSVGAVLDPELPDQVRGDARRLRQVLTNLLSNAIKFTADGFVRLRVSAAGGDRETVMCRVDVEDSGIGIDEALLPHLFEPFVQAGDATGRGYGGTGLGLSIAAGIVSAMGSRIDVESTPGVGSRFGFTVALGRGRRDVLALRSGFGQHVVMATHDPVLVEALQAQAARLRLRLRIAETPTALRRLLSGLPLAMLLDSRWPDEGAARAMARAAGVAVVDVLDSHATPLSGPAGLHVRAPVRLAALAHVLTTLRPHERLVARSGVSGVPEGTWRILVAEDDLASQDLMGRVLAAAGVQADVVASGEAARDAVARTRYDLVFMDCRMPGMDGLDATRAIRRTTGGAAVPIIGLTASALPGTRHACLDAGMTDFLAKPARPSSIVDMLRRWLASAEAPQAPQSLHHGPATPAAEPAPPLLDGDAVTELARLGVLTEMARRVVSDAPCRIGDLVEAVDRDDRRRVADVAHGLTTLLGNVGWSRAAAMASRLERACHEAERAERVALW